MLRCDSRRNRSCDLKNRCAIFSRFPRGKSLLWKLHRPRRIPRARMRKRLSQSVQPETVDSTPQQHDTASTEMPNEQRTFFEVPPLNITEGEIPIVTESWSDSGRLIDSAIEFTTPTEFKAPPVAPIEDSYPTANFFEPPVLKTSDETAFERNSGSDVHDRGNSTWLIRRLSGSRRKH